ncbi:hypothetical protein [Streptomyces paludis]|uniref:Uncharacterized protein n=1 Tax=Streptomyces paludis TaxID=2282738 RepID=A0A345HIW8_9ACTN|nr:hypothetical protein [Streptomyces paludis]AXG76642.1 hypothetical protein DVK44_01960 [Streptomyces paludis]
MRGDDDEPIFVRSKWGTNRYVYSTRNPVGRWLIFGTVVLVLGMIWQLFAGSRWSEGELRAGVHKAAEALEAKPQQVGFVNTYDSLIREAIRNSGEAPSSGGGFKVTPVPDESGSGSGGESGTDRAASGTSDFEITSEDVSSVYCLRVSPPEPDKVADHGEITLSVTVEENRCG